MKKILIAFDVDGTLAQNGALEEHEIVANERIRSLLIIMAHMKNVRILVWSGGGELWARQASRQLGIEKYVDEYGDKHLMGKNEAGHPIFDPTHKPDIAIDDIQDCELGNINLIVREK
jgi:phosphoserine phosphatase